MTGRRKGTPCACETDPCSCGSSKGKCIRTINNLSPDPNGDFYIEAGSGITITQTGDNSFEVSFDGTLPSNPLIYKGTVGSGGTVAVLPAADPDNIGWCYIAIEAATSPVTYEVGDVLISDGYTWQVVPSGDEIINIVTSWQATPDDQHVPSEKLVKDSLDGKVDKLITPMIGAYVHVSTAQTEIPVSVNAVGTTLMYRNSYGRSEVKDPAADTDSDVVVNVRTLNRRLTDGSVSKIGTVNVGSDTKPIKLVGGVPTPVTDDLVSTAGAQTIPGAKTFTSNIFLTKINPDILITNTNIDRTVTPSGSTYLGIKNYDVNGKYLNILGFQRTPTTQATYLGVYRQGSADVQSVLGVYDDGANSWATCPNSAYNPSNTNHVVNISLLDAYTPMVRITNNQIIDGIKTFLKDNPRKINQNLAYRPASYVGIYPQAIIGSDDNNIIRYRLNFEPVNSSVGWQMFAENNQATRKSIQLLFAVNHSTGACALQLITTTGNYVNLATWSDTELIDA